MQNFIARPNAIRSRIQPFNFWEIRYRAARDNCSIYPVALPFAFQFVRAYKMRVGANDLKLLARALPNFPIAISAKILDLTIFPTHDLREILVRVTWFYLEPAMPSRMMHCVDGLKDRLRRHAAGVNAKRRVIGVIPHKKQNVRAKIRRGTRGGESRRSATNDRNGFCFLHDIVEKISLPSSTAAIACSSNGR